MNASHGVGTLLWLSVVLSGVLSLSALTAASGSDPATRIPGSPQPDNGAPGLGGPRQDSRPASPPPATKGTSAAEAAEAQISDARGTMDASTLTLVERDLAGHVRRLEISLESAALQRITRVFSLSKADIAPAEQVIAKRAAKIDAFVENNIDLLTKLGTAFAGTDKVDQAQLLLEATGKLQSSLLESPMERQVQDVLPKQYQRPFQQLVTGYWDAIAEDRLSDPATNKNAEGKPETRLSVLGSERTAALGKQIELSLQRSLKSGTLAYSYLMKGITVTREQEPKLREFFAAHAEASKGDATDEQNKKLFWQVYSVLDADQQTIALRNVNGLSGKAPKRKFAAPSGKP